MPTRPGFDLVPLRKETKARLARLKGDGTFDDVLRMLLDAAERPPAAPLDRPRHPDEQVALAALATRRWRMAVDAGRIEELGPRLVVLHTGRAPGRTLRVERA